MKKIIVMLLLCAVLSASLVGIGCEGQKPTTQKEDPNKKKDEMQVDTQGKDGGMKE